MKLINFPMLVSLLLTVIMAVSGCGSSAPATVNNGTPVTSSAFFKLKAGNKWDYNKTTVVTFSALGVASSTTAIASATVTTNASTPAGLTPILTNGIVTSNLMINASSDVNTYNAAGVLQGTIPATVGPGTTFTLVSGSMTVACTVVATNVSVTVPAGTFTNVVQASYTITAGLPAGTTGSGVIYFSTLAGREIKNTTTLQGTINVVVGGIPLTVNATTTATDDLLPGYIALP